MGKGIIIFWRIDCIHATEEEIMEEKALGKNLDKKKIILIVAAVVTSLLVIYLGLSVYFMNHFYFRSKIGDIDVSGKSAAAAEKVVNNALREYELVIKERDGSTDSILGEEIKLSVEWEQKPETYIEKQNGFAWIIKVFAPDTHEINGTVSYDEAKLEEMVNSLSCMEEKKQVAPVDAKVSEYDVKKGYTLVPSVPGTAVDKDALYKCIETNLTTLNTELDMVEDGGYVQPAVADDNEKLLATIEQLNKCLKSSITYQVGSRTETLDATTFQPWLFVNENLEVVVNDEALSAYIKSLGSKYNTCYSKKQFMTSYGQEITIWNSHYGWRVDSEAEKAAIIADLMTGESVTRDLNYNMVGNSRDGNDYGNSYVEINLTAQHLFVYVNGQRVVETDIISGNVARGWNTPTGIWGITYKTKNATLRGDDYATPVSYWMPFAGNVGMHDCYWKSEFGGGFYKRSGSHGCINIPPSNAKKIYEYVSQGFPVIVYELEGTQTELGVAHDQAYAMVDAINAIGPVSLQSEAAIVACRTQYDALSDLAKKYVTNYQVLLDAEAALAALKPPVAAPGL